MTIKITTAELGGAHGRYHRQELIPWWDQARLAEAKVLLVGAGALGNEILKALVLTGVGRVLVYDMDRIERSNLSRAVLFRDDDEGRLKVEAAAGRARELNPDVRVQGRADNVLLGAGLGVFAWADVVICGVDNREARVFINSACARVGKRWVDGAIEGLDGIVRVFDPADGPCYECTMNATDRKLLAERRSCALLARDIVAQGHAPATAVAASIVGGMQTQEAIKLLHGQPALSGEGLHLMGLWSEVTRVRYPRIEDCPGHDGLGTIEPLGAGSDDVTLEALLARAEAELGEGAVLELSRDVITALTCPECGHQAPGGVPLGGLVERDAACPECGAHRIVDFTGVVDRLTDVDLSRTPRQLGLPPFDVIAARQGLDARRAWLLDGDADEILGEVA